MEENNFNFSVDVQIRMSDLDPFAHVNNGAQCHLFDFGRSSYLEALNGEAINWFKIDLVIVHLELDFISPVMMSDAIVCDVRIYEIGNKSLKMLQQLRDKKTHQVKTICRSVLSGFDRELQNSKLISEEYKKRIRLFEKMKE